MLGGFYLFEEEIRLKFRINIVFEEIEDKDVNFFRLRVEIWCIIIFWSV